jgi:hypothetical protein
MADLEVFLENVPLIDVAFCVVECAQFAPGDEIAVLEVIFLLVVEFRLHFKGSDADDLAAGERV